MQKKTRSILEELDTLYNDKYSNSMKDGMLLRAEQVM
jgi:hypothetical protein